jgi:tetratricopeptide (TPR) repeat protein
MVALLCVEIMLCSSEGGGMMRVVVAAACLVGLAAPSAWGETTATISLEDSHRKELNDAFAQIRRGNPESAIEIADRVIAAYERRYRGRTVRCANDNDDAVKVILLTLEKGRDLTILGAGWCEALFVKGFAFIDLHRTSEAEAALAEAVRMAPSNAHYLNEYGELWKSRREWQRSFDIFARAYELADHNPKGRDAKMVARSLRGMGYAKIELGDLDEAERLFRRSLEFDPTNPGTRTELEYIARKKASGT